MLIILTLYLVLAWLVFAKLKLVRWGWISGAVTVVGGALILAVFVAMFNHLTPSGSFVVVSRVIEVTPNVAGQVTAIPVKPNEPVKAGAVLFRIDPTPFRFKVVSSKHRSRRPHQQVKQLKASYEQASANVDGLSKQHAYNTQRLADMRTLTDQQALSVFREQDTQVQYETVFAQLHAAKAAQENARLAMKSEIGGVNTTVAQITAQLDNARWELDQTTIAAPGDGYVSTLTLTVGDRALPARSVMSFIVQDEITIVGMFSPNRIPDNPTGRTGQARIRQRSGPHPRRADCHDPRGHRPGSGRGLRRVGPRRLDRRRQGLSGGDLDSRQRWTGTSSASACRALRPCLRDRRRAHRTADVDPGVDQLVHRISVIIGSFP